MREDTPARLSGTVPGRRLPARLAIQRRLEPLRLRPRRFPFGAQEVEDALPVRRVEPLPAVEHQRAGVVEGVAAAEKVADLVLLVGVTVPERDFCTLRLTA